MRRLPAVCTLFAAVILPFSSETQLAKAQGSVVVAVSDSLQRSVIRGRSIAVPVKILPTGGVNVATFDSDVIFGFARFRFDSITSSTFGTLTPNTTNAATGLLSLRATRGSGQAQADTLAYLYFTADSDRSSSLSFSSVIGSRVRARAQGARNALDASVLAAVTSRTLEVCVVSGGWGDVNDDGFVNIIDAQQIARVSVGFTPGNDSAMAQRGDINNTGSRDIIDAQQTARFSVGLSATARINTPVFLPPAVLAMSVSPSGAQVMTVGSTLQLTADPRGLTNLPLGGCSPTTWTSSDNAVATVSSTGVVTALTAGSAMITAASGGQTATTTLVTTSVITGGDTPCELTIANAAYCWGRNTRGQVGDGSTTNRNTPVAVAGGNTFTSLAKGNGEHVCALTGAGAAYCWGNNAFGQLGNGTTTDAASPVAVGGALTFTKIAIGPTATCGLNSGGAVYCWGSGGSEFAGGGQMGTVQASPALMNFGVLTFTDIAISASHACGIATGGAMYCWGLNANGQLGDGTKVNRSTPTPVSGGITFSEVASGASHTCARTTASAIYCWGSNALGQLGNGSLVDAVQPAQITSNLSWSSLTAGGNTTCATSNVGDAYCWGANQSGELGTGLTGGGLAPSSVPALVGGGVTFTRVTTRNQVTCGRANISNAQPFCWGDNSFGKAGDNAGSNPYFPSPVTWVDGTAGVAVSMTIANGDQQTAPAGAAVPIAPSVLVRDFANNPVSGISVAFNPGVGGGSITAGSGITNAQGIATVGSWSVGSTPSTLNTLTATSTGLGTPLFLATSTPAAASMVLFAGDNQVAPSSVQFPMPLTVRVLDGSNAPVPSARVTFAVTSGQGAISGGAVQYTDASGFARGLISPFSSIPGNLTVSATSPGLLTVSFANLRGVGTVQSGPDTHCELTSAGAAYCWGQNNKGQVGDGTTTGRLIPVPVQGGQTFTSLATGNGEHRCALTSAGVAYCWGLNNLGQLGDGTTIDRTTPVPVSGGLTFTKLTISQTATCGRTSAGALYCWGWSGAGMLGDGVFGASRLVPMQVVSAISFTDVAIGSQHICAIATGGQLYCWGSNGSGQLGDGTNTVRATPTPVQGGQTFVSVAAMGSTNANEAPTTCAVTNAGVAHCWGFNAFGMVGDGTSTNRNVPTPVSAVNGIGTVSLVALARLTSCALATSGAVWCWGNGSAGQLGNGANTNSLAPAQAFTAMSFTGVRPSGNTTCARAGGSLSGLPYCWGGNGAGQVGDNTTTTRTTPTAVVWVEGSPGVPVTMSAVAGDQVTGIAGFDVAPGATVRVRDYANNPVSGVNVTFGVTTGGGTVSGAALQTDAKGLATVGAWTLGAAGANSITASASSLVPLTFRATATPMSESVVSGTWRQIWGGMSGCSDCINTRAHIIAMEVYSELQNFGMSYFANIPRSVVPNDPLDANSTSNYSSFLTFSTQARTAMTALRAINVAAQASTASPPNALGSKAQDARARAFAYFSAGWALGSLAMAYDSAAIVVDTSSTSITPPLSPYTVVSTAALAMLDSAVAWANHPDNSIGSNGFPLPSTWVNGNAMTQGQFVALTRSQKARIRAGTARTLSERQSVNWAAVIADAQNGITTDFQLTLNASQGWSTVGVYDVGNMNTGPIWGQLSMMYLGMADTSGAYANFIATPLASRSGSNMFVRTPDTRFPQGATRAAQQTDTPSPLPAARYIRNRLSGSDIITVNAYGYSQYDFRRWEALSASGSGPWTQISKVEIDMLQAEGHLRMGNTASALPLINASRTVRGLPPLTTFSAVAPGGNGCVPKVPSGGTVSCGSYMEAMKWEKRMETMFSCTFLCWFTDSRGWGDLPQGSPVHWPVPWQERDARGVPRYTLPGTASPGTYGW